MKLEIDWLKKNHQMIHYFGLGFIQVKINNLYRMHFYTPKLVAIVNKEEIHNHRYNFKSTILMGSLNQEVFQKISGDTHTIEDESCSPNVQAQSSPSLCGILSTTYHNYSRGSCYFINHNTFHRVKAYGECITLIKRSDYKKENAQVIRPVNGHKVCPFSQKVDANELWSVIEGMLGKPTTSVVNNALVTKTA